MRLEVAPQLWGNGSKCKRYTPRRWWGDTSEAISLKEPKIACPINTAPPTTSTTIHTHADLSSTKKRGGGGGVGGGQIWIGGGVEIPPQEGLVGKKDSEGRPWLVLAVLSRAPGQAIA